MLSILSYCLFIIVVAIGFGNRKSKVVSLIIAFYMWAIMGLNTFTPDYESYVFRYENSLMFFAGENFEIEWGYMGLNLIFNYLGFSYPQFRMFYCAIYAVIAIKAARRLSDNPNFVLSFLLIWPFLPNVSGQRFSMAAIILCWGIPFLLESGKKGIIKYLSTLVIASSFHASITFFLILLCARKWDISSHLKILYIASFSLLLFVIFSTQLGELASLFNNQKMNMWLNKESEADLNRPTLVGFLTNTSSILLAAYVVYKQSNIICKLQLISDKSKQRVALYRNVVLLLLLVIPFFVLAGEFYRYLFAILPVIYAVYSNFWNYKIMIPKNSWVRYAYFALLSIFWPAFLYIIGMKTHNVLSTLTDNMLFNG